MNELAGKHLLYSTGICLIDHRCISQVTFSFGGFFGQDMAFVSMLPFNLAGTREGKSLLGSGLCLHLWHYSKFYVELFSWCDDHDHSFTFQQG